MQTVERNSTYAAIHERLAGSPLADDFAEIQRALEDAERDYNGWKNYPTWAVNLWLNNDQGLYEETVRMVEGVKETCKDPENRGQVWTEAECLRYTTADVLKQWVNEELAPDLGASFAADLLGYALDCVDWHEIADAWIEVANDR